MIKDNKFENEILGKLKDEKIHPTPRWHFLLKNYVIWVVGGLSLVVGGLAFSVIIYLLQHNDWGVYDQISNSFLEFVILTLPYFWFLVLLLFIFIVNYNLRHTKRGYQYRLPVVVSGSIITSMILGLLFFGAGMGLALDDVLGEKVPFYEKIINPKMKIWERPDKGRLSGLVAGQLTDCEYQLLDRVHQEWIINIEKTREGCIQELEIGRPIKIIGQARSGVNYFLVEEIIPHGPGRGLFMRNKDFAERNFEEKYKTMKRLEGTPGFEDHMKEMKKLIEQYPDLQEKMEEEMFRDRELIKRILKEDPSLLERMKNSPMSDELKKELGID